MMQMATKASNAYSEIEHPYLHLFWYFDFISFI